MGTPGFPFSFCDACRVSRNDAPFRRNAMPRKQKKPPPRPEQPPSDRVKFVEEVFPPGTFPSGFTVRDEANAIVAHAFRNGPIEDLHAGKYSELLSDASL